METGRSAASTALDDHRRIGDDLEVKIHSSGSASGQQQQAERPDTASADDIRLHTSFRDKLLHVMHSFRYQVAVITLVVLDCVCVIAELLIDLEVHVGQQGSTAKEVMHSISIGILSCFLLEILVKLYAYRLEYFTLGWEMFDALVVIVSFALDVAYRHSAGPVNGVGLIIVLRLWRVTRIINGMVMSVRRASERRLEQEREARGRLQEELDRCQSQCQNLEHQLRTAHQLLKQHGISPPPAEFTDSVVNGT